MRRATISLGILAVGLWAVTLSTEGDVSQIGQNPLGFWREVIFKWSAPLSSAVAAVAIFLTWQNVLIARRQLSLREAEEEQNVPRLILDYTRATIASYNGFYNYNIRAAVTNASARPVSITESALEFIGGSGVGPPTRLVLPTIDPRRLESGTPAPSDDVSYLVAPLEIDPFRTSSGNLYVRVPEDIFGRFPAEHIAIKMTDASGRSFSRTVTLVLPEEKR